jgi:hypothetical protein
MPDNNKNSVWDRIKKYAPAVATALINPVAGGAMAIKTLSKQLGVEETEDAVAAAVERMSDSELQIQLKTLDLAFHKASLEAEEKRYQADADVLIKVQDTAIAEVNSDDVYVRRTRPMIGRWSFFLGAGYSIGAELLEFISPLIDLEALSKTQGTTSELMSAVMQAAAKVAENGGADPLIATAIFAPCMAYIGARSIDKRKPWAK